MAETDMQLMHDLDSLIGERKAQKVAASFELVQIAQRIGQPFASLEDSILAAYMEIDDPDFTCQPV